MLAVPLLVAATSGVASAGTAKPEARRVLVISLPAVTWEDIEARVHALPNLTRLLDSSAIGALGDKLASSDWSRAVIANGDGEDTEQLIGGYYRRQAVAGLMGSDGEVPTGAVGPELLVPDAQAPFGLRYENEAVLRAFRNVWKPHT